MTVRNDLARLLIPALPALAASCASSPLETQEAVQIASGRPLPRTILVKVECEGEDLYGSREEWCSGIAEVFRALNVGTSIWTGDGLEDKADVIVDLHVKAKDPPRDPEIDGQAALLTTLAWSAIPILPWFLHDVLHDPGIQVHVKVEAVSPYGRRSMIPEPEKDLRVKLVPTSLRERYPIASWSTLGVIAVPPFVFQGGDRHRVIGAIIPRARMNIALDFANIVKGGLPRDPEELFEDLTLEPSGASWSLRYVPGQELLKFTLRVEPSDPTISPQSWGSLERPGVTVGHRPLASQVPLSAILPPSPPPGLLLRIDAFGRKGTRARYSLAIPSGASREAAGKEEA